MKYLKEFVNATENLDIIVCCDDDTYEFWIPVQIQLRTITEPLYIMCNTDNLERSPKHELLICGEKAMRKWAEDQEEKLYRAGHDTEIIHQNLLWMIRGFNTKIVQLGDELENAKNPLPETA